MSLEIIRIEALVLSTTIFQIYSLVLPLSVFMKLLFLSFICILKSFVSTFLIWFQPSLEVVLLLVIAVTTTMLIVLIQNFLHNLLLNIKPNRSVCDKRKITF